MTLYYDISAFLSDYSKSKIQERRLYTFHPHLMYICMFCAYVYLAVKRFLVVDSGINLEKDYQSSYFILYGKIHYSNAQVLYNLIYRSCSKILAHRWSQGRFGGLG